MMIIPMGLNADGEGPADEADTVRTVFQIWDDEFVTLSEHNTRQEAETELARLTKSK